MEEIDLELQSLSEAYDLGLQYIYSFSSTEIEIQSIYSSSSTQIEIQSIYCSSSTEIGSDDDESIQQEKNRKGGVLSEKEDIEACLTVVTETQDGEGRTKEGTVTRTRTKSSLKDPGPPPDGGREAWIQAVMGHLVVMNTRGFINTFGVFQTYYVTALQKTPSAISWVGSTQVFLLFFVSTFAGRLTDAGYFRSVFLLGSILGVFGLFMASLSTQYWQLFIAQGVCCGLGSGLLFCPALSLVSTYFSKKRPLAIGIAAAGSATGGMVFPALVEQLLPKIGFPWTMRMLAFIQLTCLGVCNVLMRTRLPPRKTGALVDWKSFREVTYSLFAVGMFFVFLGVYFAFFYVGSFGQDVIHLPYAESINILIVLNSMGAFGRIVSGLVGDRYLGGQNTLILIVALTSMLLFCWIGVTSRGGMYAWATIYGIVGAAIQTLFPATLASLTTDLRMAGTRMGMVFTILSFAVLTGPPMAGQLIQKKGGAYEYAQFFAGAVMVVGCCFLIAARYSTKKKFLVRI